MDREVFKRKGLEAIHYTSDIAIIATGVATLPKMLDDIINAKIQSNEADFLIPGGIIIALNLIGSRAEKKAKQPSSNQILSINESIEPRG